MKFINFLNYFMHNNKYNKIEEKGLIESCDVIKTLKFIFGEYEFNRLYKFFLNISIKNRFDVIVFTTRRCHILFSIFKKYVFTDEEKEILSKNHKLYISDKAIHFYKRKISKSKILIVDDIMIHGRALKDVRIRVEKFNPHKIEVVVYAISEGSPKDNIKFELKLANDEWKSLSNRIVASIILTSTPYASYIYAFSKKMERKEFYKLKESLDKKFIFENNNIDIDDNKIDPNDTILDLSLKESDNSNELNSILSKYIQGYIYPLHTNRNENKEFLRVYYNESTKICILIPIVFLGEYSDDQLTKECKNLHLDKVVNSQPEIIYRALTAYYSLTVFGKYNEYIPDCLNDPSWNVNDQTINMSYYDNFYNDLYNLISEKNNSNHLQLKFAYDKKYNLNSFDIHDYSVSSKKSNHILEDDIYLIVFKKMLSDVLSDENNMFPYNNEFEHNASTIFLYDYIRQVNFNEEEYLKNKKPNEAEKQIGFSFVLSKFIFDKRIMKPFQFYSKLVSGADSGLITFYADKFNLNKEVLYSNFLITGEQVCRLYQNKYFILVLYLIEYYFNSKNDETQNIQIDLNTYKDRILNASISDNVRENINKVFLYLERTNHLKMDEFIEFFIDNIYEGINDQELKSILQNGCNYLS